MDRVALLIMTQQRLLLQFESAALPTTFEHWVGSPTALTSPASKLLITPTESLREKEYL